MRDPGDPRDPHGGRGDHNSGGPRTPGRLSDPGRVLIWDLDGTIADTRADIATGVVEMLRELGRPTLDLAHVIRNVGRGVKALVTGCLADTGQPARDAAEIERAVDVFRAHYWHHLMDTTVPYAGMPEILRELATRGRPMAIVSNKPQDATREILRRMGLLDCFVVVLGGDSLPVRKPDPAPLLYALRVCLAGAPGGLRLASGQQASEAPLREMASRHAVDESSLCDAAPYNAAMIGDSLPDVQAARAAGIPACGVAWGFDPDGEMRRAELDWWFENVEDLGGALRGQPSGQPDVPAVQSSP
jgi:phosphoglycolate phosphatase